MHINVRIAQVRISIIHVLGNGSTVRWDTEEGLAMIVTLGAKEILWNLCIYAYKNLFKKTLVSTCIAQIDNTSRQEERNLATRHGKSRAAEWNCEQVSNT